MIKVRDIEFDFDAGRVKDAERMEEAKPKLKEAFSALKNPGNAKFSELSRVSIEAVSAILGEDAPAKLEMDKENYADCILIFADVATAVMENEKAVNEKLTKYDLSRLGL